MSARQLLQALIVVGDGLVKWLQLANQSFDHHGSRCEDGGVLGQGFGLGDDLQTLLDQLLPPRIVGVKEGPYLSWLGFLEFLQRGPFGQEGRYHGKSHVLEDLQSLWEDQLKAWGQCIDKAAASFDQSTPILAQLPQSAGLHRVGHPNSQSITMVDQEIQQQISVDGIGFGTIGIHGFPVIGRGLGVDLIDNEGRIIEQVVNEPRAVAFDNASQFLIGEPGQQAVAPVA